MTRLHTAMKSCEREHKVATKLEKEESKKLGAVLQMPALNGGDGMICSVQIESQRKEGQIGTEDLSKYRMSKSPLELRQKASRISKP